MLQDSIIGDTPSEFHRVSNELPQGAYRATIRA